jgi:hypothetical protein
MLDASIDGKKLRTSSQKIYPSFRQNPCADVRMYAVGVNTLHLPEEARV